MENICRQLNYSFIPSYEAIETAHYPECHTIRKAQLQSKIRKSVQFCVKTVPIKPDLLSFALNFGLSIVGV